MIIITERIPNSEEIIVEGETESWYVAKCGKTYDKDRFMKVERPQWRNVTHEVEVREPTYKSHEPGGIYHKGVQIAQLHCGGRYRLKIDGLTAKIQEKVL